MTRSGRNAMAETAELHPADGKKPIKYKDMTESARKALRRTVGADTKHGIDDPYPNGPVVMEGVELMDEHPDIGGL